MKKVINASVGIDRNDLAQLRRSLQTAYDIMSAMNEETYGVIEDIDGSLYEHIGDAIQDLSHVE